ncbi:MAG: hypothetical protein ACRD90_02560 [Nitrosopumilaceae archaeon]
MLIETIQIPFIIEAMRSEIILRKRDSDLDGITVTVLVRGPDPIDTTIAPIFSFPSVIEIKLPLSNGTT